MKIICMYCKKFIGEKEPLNDPDISHSICQECMEKKYRGEKRVKRILSKDGMKVICRKWYSQGEIIPLRLCEMRQEVVGKDGFLSCQNCINYVKKGVPRTGN